MTLPNPAKGPQVLRAVRRRRRQPRGGGRGAQARWSSSTTGSTSASPTSRRSRSAATRSTARSTAQLEDAFVTPFDREDIHELVSRLDDVVDGVQAIAETFVIYGVTAPTHEARRLAAILDEQGVELVAALRKLDGLKDLEAPPRRGPRARERGRRAVTGGGRAALPRRSCRRSRSSSGATSTTTLEDTIDAAEDAAEAMERMYHKAN